MNEVLSINMDKTKAMMFNTTQAGLTRSETKFLGEEKVAYTHTPTIT